ncbi:MAG: methyl-viologen-reducing hydrogenase subunit delta [Deltaproteobacteria bacterium CG12_big_fil_rev_8_21_14_0_65_43_10]|nr:MAG: methyl-viologen-reducing hydrogenase subunit delta [Deltaproteobacteria bacterium CG2_30_43_15]PIQ44848.1 MAG: methyl-viologen-reducing hydrogenase subunit delta [Deltaproteobacteria bacterium CG12_big_fil_rev_8_21_14_0_65_43_10]PIU86738.1 MAG: hydrogenase iron-sulfur subunit [Deltaproteobacteria bacterium CG06_land_8_20_14_3_00_44_19]PIX26421.1 MAG: hydrogenase iron-sulfur subunit [Deltaproteobacteria bacterium CG_4_8_14_3_um_filter_43_13]PIZ19047.1 MAG: hydrogenase iron-sulfur subunit
MEETKWEPKVVGFLCHWCSYAGADLTGSARMEYPHNIRIIRVPCSGRIDPMFILRALQNGLDGVLVSGCHPGDCHYQSGNFHARRKFAVTRKLLEYVGIEPERVQFSWVAASEGPKMAQVVKEFVEGVRKVGPNRLFKDEIRDGE